MLTSLSRRILTGVSIAVCLVPVAGCESESPPPEAGLAWISDGPRVVIDCDHMTGTITISQGVLASEDDRPSVDADGWSRTPSTRIISGKADSCLCPSSWSDVPAGWTIEHLGDSFNSSPIDPSATYYFLVEFGGGLKIGGISATPLKADGVARSDRGSRPIADFGCGV